MKKRYAVALIVLAFVVGMLSSGGYFAGANQSISVWINGKPLISSPGPRLIDGRVFVPLRAVSDSMGANVGWDSQTNTAYIASQGDALTDIEIVGDAAFKKAMRDGLELLRDKSPEDYAFVGRYVRKIVLSDMTLPTSAPNHMTVHIPLNYKPDPIWWGAGIVHEAQHAEQWYSAKNMTIEQMETEAGQRDLQTLAKLGAPQWEIDYVKEQLKNMNWWK